jgi:penicillin-binding protein 2
MTEGRTSLRIRVLATLVAFMFASLATRLWFLQVLAAEKYRAEVGNNVVRTLETPAKRGQILDDQGHVLVDNRISLVITVNREEAGDHEEQVIYNLAKLLRTTPKEMAKRVENIRYYRYQPVPVAADVSWKVVAWIKEHPSDFPGVDYLEQPVRTYPYGSLAAHVLGYLGQISPDQLKDPAFAGYQAGDIVGQTGVERQYERWLEGTKGIVKYRVDRFGNNKGEIGELPPRPGDNLVLTLDARIQQIAEQTLSDGIAFARTQAETGSNGLFKATGGALIVMDPTNGDIKALASYPTYNPSAFIRGMPQSEYERRFGASHDYPLLDRALQGEYPPGSTYKPFVALSALRRGLANESTYYDCPPSYYVPKDPLHEHFDNWSFPVGLGSLNLAGALVQSCDTVFYPFGFQYWQQWYPTRDTARPTLPLQRDLRSFGFGRPTGIDVPFERAGLVPDPMWKARVHKEMPKVYPEGSTYPADFILMTIGQGETLVTPLQLATGFSAIANGGLECWPHVGGEITSPTGNVIRRIRPRCDDRLPFSAQTISYVRNALNGVVTSGTAASAFTGFPFSQVSVAGKTGTAQVTGQQDDSWFAAIADGQGKQYVIVCLIEQGGHGATTAAPIVRRAIEQIYGLTPSQFTNGGPTD